LFTGEEKSTPVKGRLHRWSQALDDMDIVTGAVLSSPVKRRLHR
jgi:hypothetical protein